MLHIGRCKYVVHPPFFAGSDRETSKEFKTIFSPSPHEDAYFKELVEDVKKFSAAVETGEQPEKEYNKMLKLINDECTTIMEDPDFLKTLERQNYDLAVVDHYYNCGFIMASKLRLTYVVLECSSGISMALDIPGSPVPLSYVPSFGSGLTGIHVSATHSHHTGPYEANQAGAFALILEPVFRLQSLDSMTPPFLSATTNLFCIHHPQPFDNGASGICNSCSCVLPTSNTSTAPDVFDKHKTLIADEMDFLERLKNVVTAAASSYFFRWWISPFHEIKDKYVPEDRRTFQVCSKS